MKVDKMNESLKFKRKNRSKQYTDLNTELRDKADNKFEGNCLQKCVR